MQRVHLHITGIVQGVGMRPFVYRVAVAHGITGWVLNAGDGVHIEAAGTAEALDAFVHALRAEAPAAARIDCIDVTACADTECPCQQSPLSATDTRAGVMPPRQSACPSDPRQSACSPASSTSEGFRIIASDDETARTTLVSPDIATCPDCLRELFDPADRRYHYPFINCTNCGPRFTIIRSLPYDRPATSMDAFPMCSACAAEYANPANRRFHAQPNACFDCGPHLTWREHAATTSGAPTAHDGCRYGTDAADTPSTTLVGSTRERSDAIIDRCVELLAAGGIVAIKGLGGFHLACNAADENAVCELRRRKRRSNKPLAVMVRDLADAQRLCVVDEAEAALLTGSVRPIVLLQRYANGTGLDSTNHVAGTDSTDGFADTLPGNTDASASKAHDSTGGPASKAHDSTGGPASVPLAPSVAFDLPELGVMLPYTPLQHLLLAACGAHGMRALVMTSGNLSDEPIECDDNLAWSRLVEHGIADALLGNNRAILARYDDSVVRVVGGVVRPVRRARGYAPQPLALLSTAVSDAAGIQPADSASVQSTGFPSTQSADSTSAQPTNSIDAAHNNTSVTPAAAASSIPAGKTSTPRRPVILACGSEQKATLAFTREESHGSARCFLSQHIGDTENATTFDAWHEARRRLSSLFDLQADTLACDLHPQYLASQWARAQAEQRGLPLVEVQHHHAHIAAGIAEAAATGALDPAQPVIGFAFDGTGFGTDGTIWGGEIFVATLASYERVGHLKPWRLPGGAAAVHNPCRNAWALLASVGLLDHPGAARLHAALNTNEVAVLRTMVERGLNSPLTSSMGRLLDAIAAITGICSTATYEGEPAIELEAAARRALMTHGGSWERALAITSPLPHFDLVQQPAPHANDATATRQQQVGERPTAEVLNIDATPLLAAVLDSCAREAEPGAIALAVHEAIAQMTCASARLVRNRTGICNVVLGGGVFLNRLLLERVPALLECDGFTVHIPHEVPVNDGGLAYGQAAVARARL